MVSLSLATEFPQLKIIPDGAVPRPTLSIQGEWGSDLWQRSVARQCSPKMQHMLWVWYGQHPFDFLKDCVKIVGKNKKLQPLDIDHRHYRRAQRYFAALICHQLWTTGRVRLVILKARQWGASSIANALLLWLMIFHPHSDCLTIADKTKKSEGILKMLKKMHKHLPEWIKPATKRSALNVIAFDGFDKDEDRHRARQTTESEIQVDTAQADAVGRSLTLNGFHASEVAFWKEKAGEVFNGCFNAVVEQGTSMVFVESTAFGWGGEFFELCKMARNGKGEWKFVFIPWFAIDEYRCCPGDSKLASVQGPVVDPVELQRLMDAGDWQAAGLDEDEIQLLAATASDMFGPIDAEQLLWRRWAIENKCKGSLETFHQEYPSNPDEAFIGSGEPVFSAGALLWQLHNHVRAGERGEFVRNPETKVVEWHPIHSGRFEMYEKVKPEHEYILTADPSEGDETPDAPHVVTPDNSCIFVGVRCNDAGTKEQVLKAKGRFVPDELGEMCLLAAEYYNCAVLAPENAAGYATPTIELAKDMGYGNVYQSAIYNTIGEEIGQKLGWVTSSTTRPQAFSTARRVIRKKQMILHSESLIDEMRTMVFKRSKAGRSSVKEEAKSGAKDDEAMTAVIFMEIDNQYGVLERLEKATRKPLDPHDPLYRQWLELRRQEANPGLVEWEEE